MCEEYLSAKEIMQQIEDLKIRLALQQEFEQEVDELVAEVNPAEAEQTQPIREMEEKVVRDIAAHTGRRRQAHEHRSRFPRGASIAAVIALLVMVCVGSAMATVHMVQIGLLKLDVQTYPERTSYSLVPSEGTMNVPQEWTGDFYPAYIPEGFEFDRCYNGIANYLDSNDKMLSFSENAYGTRISLDTENANLSSVFINGAEATLIEKDGWTAVVWSANNRLFIVDIDGGKDDVLRVAASVILIKQ
mgnify:CR=1 FL=1